MPAPTTVPRRWVVLAATELEVRALRAFAAAGGTELDVEVAGFGRAGDPAVEELLRARTAGTILNLGLAGALDPALRPGAVVLTTRWLDPETGAETAHTDDTERALVKRWLGPAGTIEEGPGITVDRPFHDRAAAVAVRERTGAVSVEMEGGAWANLARRAGWSYVAVRVISDGADLALPAPRHRLLSASGTIRLGAWLRALPARSRPITAEWRALRQAQSDWRQAMASLSLVSTLLARQLSSTETSFETPLSSMVTP